MTPWKVKVGAQRAVDIQSSEAHARLERAGFVPLLLANDQFQVNRGADDACLFRSDDGCEIHRELGSFSKPTVCQLYPLSLVNTPDGYYASLLFSCPSVVEGLGSPLSEQLSDVRRTLEESEYFTGVAVEASEIVLTEGVTVGWTEWKALESQVLEVLKAGHGVSGALRLAASIIGHRRSGEGRWQPSLYQADDVDEVAGLFPIYTCFAVAILEGAHEVAEQERICDLLLNGQACYSKHLGMELSELEFKGPLNDHSAAVTTRFLQNFVLGKRILQDGTVLARCLALGVSLAALNYYHRMVVEREPNREFPHGALAWSFELIEAALLGHSDKAMGLFAGYERQLVHVH